MTSHELAQKLLAGPNVDLVSWDHDGVFMESLTSVSEPFVAFKHELTGSYSKEPFATSLSVEMTVILLG